MIDASLCGTRHFIPSRFRSNTMECPFHLSYGANDVTRSFQDIRLLPALPVLASPGYLHGNGITRISQFKSPYCYGSRPRGCVQSLKSSLQLPLVLPDSSSHCLLSFFAVFFFSIAEMKAISKLRSLHPSAERPLQGMRGSILSVNCPHADITGANVQYAPRCYF